MAKSRLCQIFAAITISIENQCNNYYLEKLKSINCKEGFCLITPLRYCIPSSKIISLLEISIKIWISNSYSPKFKQSFSRDLNATSPQTISSPWPINSCNSCKSLLISWRLARKSASEIWAFFSLKSQFSTIIKFEMYIKDVSISSIFSCKGLSCLKVVIRILVIFLGVLLNRINLELI